MILTTQVFTKCASRTIRLCWKICGTAPMLSLLTEEYPGTHFAGPDLTPEMIAKAKAKNLPNTEPVVGDCENLPFAPEIFDAVLLIKAPNLYLHMTHPANYNVGKNIKKI